jgi:hypothetical protein
VDKNERVSRIFILGLYRGNRLRKTYSIPFEIHFPTVLGHIFLLPLPQLEYFLKRTDGKAVKKDF